MKPVTPESPLRLAKRGLGDIVGLAQRPLQLLRPAPASDAELREQLQAVRDSEAYQSVFTESEPLVSVCVATWNRADLLTQRCIPSILEQTYRNIEVLVVGDACTDATAELVAKIDDPRLRFLNLDKRGDYGEGEEARWHIAGALPMETAYGMARGAFITQLDDDDEYTPDRIEKLVPFAQANRADLVFHPYFHEQQDGRWIRNSARVLRRARVTSGALFFHNWFGRVNYDGRTIRERHEPGDFHKCRRIRYLTPRVFRHPEALMWHYKERQNG